MHRARERDIPIAGYAAAHLGKSLWWNASELFLAFYLTEYLALDAVAAAGAVAAGLVAGGAMDLMVARRRDWFASVPRAGRIQALGALGSLAALLLLMVAARAGEDLRLVAVIAANLVFRLAYVFYDLPQNCLLCLVDWSRERQRKAAAARTAAGAGALMLVSFLVSLHVIMPGTGMAATLLVAVAAAGASGSAIWLWCATSSHPDLPQNRRGSAPAPAPSIGWAVAMMAIVCLTLPAFSKLVPYLAAYARHPAPSPLLLLIGLCTAASQPLWLSLLRRRGEAGAVTIAGALLIAAAALAAAGALAPAAIAIGAASGGLGTVIWASLAAAVIDDDPLDAAPAFARLTATAKVSLAVAALLIGAVLRGTDYRSDAGLLLPFMIIVVLAGGIGVIALAWFGAAIRRETPAGSA